MIESDSSLRGLRGLVGVVLMNYHEVEVQKVYLGLEPWVPKLTSSDKEKNCYKRVWGVTSLPMATMVKERKAQSLAEKHCGSSLEFLLSLDML